MRTRGFTLIELMIVVAIIGILANYAMPNYTSRIVAKQVNEGILLGASYQERIANFRRVNGRFPRNNSELNVPPSDKILGNYTTGVSIENGAIHISFGNHIHKAVREKTLSLRPLTVPRSPNSPLAWTCGYREAPDGMTANGLNKTDVISHMVPLECM